MKILPLALLAAVFLPSVAFADEGDEAPEVTVGRRLFLETRFSQFFFANSKGQLNRPLPSGDPVMNRTEGAAVALPGAFAGRSMNCRACHLVNEHQGIRVAGVRTYTDFARHSPIPARGDGMSITPRRSPVLVNSTLPRSVPILLHYDGEFASIEDLVRGTLTGRNFGWRPDEAAAAIRHVAAVVRQDDGRDLFAQQTARLSYAALLKSSDDAPPFVRLPEPYRIDVAKATDDEVLGAVAKLIGVYVDSLQFAVFRPDQGALYAGSPYDFFLVKNGLPRRPESDESPIAYARRLRKDVNALEKPEWVTPKDARFKLHAQPFRFGPLELEGLKNFLSEPSAGAARVGNCVACHTPPAFTDFLFHNTGAAQEEYDAIHGAGAFAGLEIPSLTRRNESPDLFLPASSARPAGKGLFRAVPGTSVPGQTDLGLWNVFANDAMPGPQKALREFLGASNPPTDADLAATIARFKTATVRDLGQTGPYFHTGRKDTLTAALRHYLEYSELARAGRVRNADPKLRGISISTADLESLQAFLQSLNEDYND